MSPNDIDVMDERAKQQAAELLSRIAIITNRPVGVVVQEALHGGSAAARDAEAFILRGKEYRRWPPEGAVEVEVAEKGFLDGNVKMVGRPDHEPMPPSGRYLLIPLEGEGE